MFCKKQQYLWNYAIQPEVGCHNVWANTHCSGCSLLGEKSLWNRIIEEKSTKNPSLPPTLSVSDRQTAKLAQISNTVSRFMWSSNSHFPRLLHFVHGKHDIEPRDCNQRISQHGRCISGVYIAMDVDSTLNVYLAKIFCISKQVHSSLIFLNG